MSDEFPVVPEQAYRLLEVLNEIAEEAISPPRGIGPHRQDFTDEAWEKMQRGNRTYTGLRHVEASVYAKKR